MARPSLRLTLGCPARSANRPLPDAGLQPGARLSQRQRAATRRRLPNHDGNEKRPHPSGQDGRQPLPPRPRAANAETGTRGASSGQARFPRALIKPKGPQPGLLAD